MSALVTTAVVHGPITADAPDDEPDLIRVTADSPTTSWLINLTRDEAIQLRDQLTHALETP